MPQEPQEPQPTVGSTAANIPENPRTSHAISRLFSNPSALPTASSPSRKLYLDALPAELVERIALHVLSSSSPFSYSSSSSPTASSSHSSFISSSAAALLPIAETTPSLAQAVLSCLLHTVTITRRMSYAQAKRWAALKPGPSCVRLEANVGPPCFALLKGGVKRVETVSDLFLLSAVRLFGGVRELRVKVIEDSDIEVLWETVEELRLEKFRVECGRRCWRWGCGEGCSRGRRRVGGGCVLNGDSFVNLLKRGCGGVKTLEVVCGCGDVERRGLWRGIDGLGGLKEVGFVGGIGPGGASLDAVEGVRMWEMTAGGWGWAMRLGEKVKEFWSEEGMSEGMLQGLGACERLERVGLIILKGAEKGLVGMVRRLGGLKELRVGFRGREGYVEIDQGCMGKAVEMGGNLEEIGFWGCRIEEREVIEMLRSTGKRLKGLEICVGGQREAPWERLEAVVRSCVEWNGDLRKLEVAEWDRHEGGFGRLEMKVERAAKWRSRLGLWLTRLKRAAPGLNVKCVEAFVDELREEVRRDNEGGDLLG